MNIAILEPEIAFASDSEEINLCAERDETVRSNRQAFDLNKRSTMITPLLDEILRRRPSFPQPLSIDD